MGIFNNKDECPECHKTIEIDIEKCPHCKVLFINVQNRRLLVELDSKIWKLKSAIYYKSFFKMLVKHKHKIFEQNKIENKKEQESLLNFKKNIFPLFREFIKKFQKINIDDLLKLIEKNKVIFLKSIIYDEVNRRLNKDGNDLIENFIKNEGIEDCSNLVVNIPEMLEYDYKGIVESLRFTDSKVKTSFLKNFNPDEYSYLLDDIKSDLSNKEAVRQIIMAYQGLRSDIPEHDDVELVFSQYNIFYNLIDKIIRLDKLLLRKNIIISVENLIEFISFKATIKHNDFFDGQIFENDQISFDDVIINYIELTGEDYNSKLDLFLNLLEKHELIDNNFDKDDLLVEIKEKRKEIELDLFESQLNNDSGKLTIDDIDIIDGYEFEKLLGKLFKKMGYEVENTKLSGDQGADLIVKKFNKKIAIQAKNYSDNVTNKAVQEVVAAKKHYNCDEAIVVTNSFFTNSAKKLAMSNNVKLWDRVILSEKVDKYL